MVTVKLKFRSPKATSVGSIFYQVIYKRVVRQVTTSFRIASEEWDEGKGCIITSPSSARSEYLEIISKELSHDKQLFAQAYDNLLASDCLVSADSIVTEFHRLKASLSFFNYMEHTICLYHKHMKARTAETYSATYNSFRRFRHDVDIALCHIDSELMLDYERFLKHNYLSHNSISFYMKHLKSVYRRALEDGLIEDSRPFRRVNTSIAPTSKRALSLETIHRLMDMDLSHSPSKSFARDLFLFSLYTRGMPFIDIAYLEKKDLRYGILTYRRQKTNQQLEIHWEQCMQQILQKYKSDNSSPFLFSIINHQEENYRRQYLNASTLINRQLKKIGEMLHLAQPLTMYCARHSWASIARDEGIPISVISKGMGHDSEKTTQIYLSSIKSDIIDKANRKILKILNQ